MQNRPYTISKIALAAIVLTGFALLYFFTWNHPANTPLCVIDGDGKDYYSYLISVFIDHNLGHQDVSEWYVIPTQTGTINVHTLGVSLLLLPFFGIAYLSALLFHVELNGLSAPFQVMVSIGALFYATLGLFFIRKLLVKLNTRDGVIAVVLLLIFFGTNLLHYSLTEPSMSHVYSFALISAFLFYTHSVFNSYSNKHFYIAAFIFGLIILVRPVNGIVLFLVPFWSNSLHDMAVKMKLILGRRKPFIFSVLICLSVLAIQSIVWYVQNGHLVQWSYKDNGFYFNHPHAIKMLFGFNAGFFIYTPLCFFLLLGLIPFYKENKFGFFALVFSLAGFVYLFSCYWAYTYFDGLGMRPLVDYYAVFAILAAKLVNYVSGIKKVTTSLILATCVCFNLVYCYQFKAGILPPSSMNYKKFKYIFLKTDASYANVLGGCADTRPYSTHHPSVSYQYRNDFEKNPEGKTYYSFGDNEYGVDYKINALGFNTNKLYVKVSLKRKEAALNSSSKAMVAFNVESPEHHTKNFQAFKLNDAPSENCCEWEQYAYAITLNGEFLANDSMTVFLWNAGKQHFDVDDFKVEVYNYNRAI